MPRFPTSNDCYLHYEVKEPVINQPSINVLLIHGYGSDGIEWDGYNRLLGNTTRLIIVDLYSHGQSSWVHPPNAGDEDLENARDVILLMKHLSFGPYFVVGHSFGGRVAGLIAVQDQQNILGAVLITPVPVKGVSILNDDPIKKGKEDALMTLVGQALSSQKLEDMEKVMLLFNGGINVRMDTISSFLSSMSHCNLKEGSNAAERGVSLAKDRSSIISSISSPLLFLSSDLDMFFKFTVAELSLFKNAGFHCFHDKGHLFPITDSVETAHVILNFIKKHNKK